MSKVSTDPIADMLTRLRNAIAINKDELKLPYSKTKETVARLLCDSGSFMTGLRIGVDGNGNPRGDIRCAKVQPAIQ